MGGGDWGGGRLELLPLILAHEEAVELDLLDKGIDYRDYFRPGGGKSRLTLRRLLLIVEDLDPFASRFWAESEAFGLWWQLNRGKKDRFATGDRALMDIAGGLSQEPYWRLRVRQIVEAEEVKAEKAARIRAGVVERERRRRLTQAAVPKKPVDPRPDLNAADVRALCVVSGVGPVLAERVVEDREQRGPFKTVADVRRVPGVGAAKATALGEKFRVTEGA